MKKQKVSIFKRIKSFVKKNSYALVVAGSALVLSVALLLTATLSMRLKNKENMESGVVENIQPPAQDVVVPVPDDAIESNTAPIVFMYPVKDYTLGHTYSDEKLVKNETLNEYTTHLGVDFLVGEGAEVVASLDGVVESISYDSLTGTTIVVDHGEGLKTSYSSLAAETMVAEGQEVKAGEVIGSASTSSGELMLGSHVHFEVTENGVLVNPMNYLGEK